MMHVRGEVVVDHRACVDAVAAAAVLAPDTADKQHAAQESCRHLAVALAVQLVLAVEVIERGMAPRVIHYDALVF